MLWCTWPNTAEHQASGIGQLIEMITTDRHLFNQTSMMATGGPDADPDTIANAVRNIAAIPTDVLLAHLHSQATHDADEYLARVGAPTLVIQPDAAAVLSSDDGTRLAAAIPGAQLATVPCTSVSILLADQKALFLLLDSFIGGTAEPNADLPPPAPQSFQTIIFTDLEASTALTQTAGDEAAQEVLRGHNAATRAALNDHGGREVKHTGDGIMAAFPSAVGAVGAALQIQRELAAGVARVRIGINAGEPINEDDDLFGTAVQLAARLTDRAEPGQVLVSRVVADLCAGKRFKFESLGDVSLKGFPEPVALFEVVSD